MGRTDKSEGRKAQIIEAATVVFAEHGYEGTTNRRIAEALAARTGTVVTPQLIYHYFASKHALFQAVMRQLPPQQRIRAAIEAAMDEPPAAFFRCVARAYLSLLDDPLAAAVIRLSITEGERAPEVAETIADVLMPAYAEPLAAYLHAAVGRGLLRPCHPAFVMLGLFGALLQTRLPVGRAMAARLPALDDHALVEGIVDNLLLGLLPRAKT